MKRLILLVPALFSVSSAGAQTASIKDMAWLQGCWEQRDGDRVVEERWMGPRAGSMLGAGRRRRRGRGAWEAPARGQHAGRRAPAARRETDRPRVRRPHRARRTPGLR